MSGNWSQGGGLQGPQNYNNNYNAPIPRAPRGRPPICFTCGQEGHYVKDCPKQNQNDQVAMAAPQGPQGPQAANINGYDSTPQTKQWANVQNGQMGSNYAPYPGSESALVSQFMGPDENAQFNGLPASAPYVAPNQSYQQYPTTRPPQQNHQQQGSSQQAYSNYHQNKQYKQPVANGSNYNQSPHQQQGSQNYQAPFNQYSQSNSPQQYGPPTHAKNGQQYPSSTISTTPLQTQNNGYNQGYSNRGSSASYQSQSPPNQGQWNGSPPATPFNPSQQQRGQEQPNLGFNREFTRSQSQQSQQGESRMGSQQPQHGDSRVEFQQAPEVNKRGLYIPRSKNTPHTAPSKASSKPAEESRASSVASTPYGSPSSKNNISEWDGHPVILKEDSDRTDEEKQFNWDFKKIFKPAGEKHETVALAQPLANRFDMTPVPLIDKKSTITISRYARRENLKEYTRSVRKTPQWPYLQEDPTFQDSQIEEQDSISFEGLDACMKLRHGDAYVSTATRKASAVITRTGKRKASKSEQDDVDEQLQAEFSTLQNKRQKINDQSYKSKDGSPRFIGSDAGNKTPPLVEASDDIWAPQEGESADPTEALLASLGVSGAPKPVEPGPPVMIPVEEFQQATYSSQQSPYGPQQALPYNNQQAPYTQQSSFNAQQPSSYNHQPPFNPQQPLYNQQPPFNAQQPGFNHQQPPFNAQQPPFNPQQSLYNQQPPFNAQQPGFNHQHPPFNNHQPPYNAQQPYIPQLQPFNHSMGNQPFRQDPGYANAHPPFSGPQMLNQHIPPPPPPPPMEEEPLFDPWPEHNVTATPPPPDHTDNDKENVKKVDEENALLESPLSPTSLEILGKINTEPAKPRKIVRIISGKKGKESSRSSEDGVPKLKRAAPVVDAAYGRRW